MLLLVTCGCLILLLLELLIWFDSSMHSSIYMPSLFNKSRRVYRLLARNLLRFSNTIACWACCWASAQGFYCRFASFNGTIKFRKFDRNSVRNIGKVQLYPPTFRPRHGSIFVRAVLFADFFRHLIKVVNACAARKPRRVSMMRQIYRPLAPLNPPFIASDLAVKIDFAEWLW